MHRLMILKKFPVSKGNFSATSSDRCYPRTCTLCNRIFSTPQGGFPRIHSTLAHPEQSSYASRKKKKSSKNLPVTKIDNPFHPKLRRKMKITVMESTTAGELPPSSFITSSPSSPVFSKPRFSGVTIMLPPNSSKNLEDTLSHIQKLTLTKPPPENGQEPPDLNHVAALMLSGLSRNRYLLDDLSSQQGHTNKQELATSQILEEVTKTAAEDIENYATIMAAKEPKKSSEELHSARTKRILSRASYVDIFVNAGNLKLAFKHAMLGIKYFPGYPGRNILLEPLFIHAAQEGDASFLVELVNLSNRYNLSLTHLSYKNCLELMGRLPKTPFNVDVIRVVLKNMEQSGVKLEDVITKCQNRPLLIKKIFEAVNCIDPQKAARHAVSSSTYNVEAVSPLNDTSQSKAKRFYSPANGLKIGENAEKLVDEQIAIHDSSVFQIKNIACEMSSSEIESLLQKQKALIEEWKVTIEAGIKSGIRNLKKDVSSSQSLGNYLECLPISTYVNLVMQEVHSRLHDSDKQSVGFIQAQRALGKRAKIFYDTQILNKYGIGDKAREAHIEYCKRYSNPELYPEGPSNPRELWESVVSELDYDDTLASQVLRKWSIDICSRIGKFLYDVLLKDVKIDENIGTDKGRVMVPALYVVYRKTTKGYQKQLKVHPVVHTVFPTRMQPYIAMDPFELPMVCPPRPWISATDGVYPRVAPRLQRVPDSPNGELALLENLESVNTQDLYPSLDSLNQLGAVPWRVNNQVLDVVVKVFKSGGMKNLAIPSPPTASLEPPSIPADAALSDKFLICKDRARIRQENANEFSLWCDTLYKLCIANEFRDRIFWLPHNMDFRGRVYPICPHLQHMSGDMARSLLIFAKGEKLGPDGLDWLKIHTMNLVGNMSKDSIAARLAYANEILPTILDSAENPLTGEKWWMDSEYPWQTLAACKEIANAIASGDPENFVSHFPVHQDGSCNGLQHYAALGRDSLGAQSVNLVDTDKPSDVYSCVATLVEQQRAKDAAEGNALAQSLEGFIARKVVKPTVMTTVYGVTTYGAQLQIQGQLTDLKYPPEAVRKAASYVMKLVFQSLGEMFTSSRNTQDWLTKCAEKIVKGRGLSVQWVTPLGLPVIQPYFKHKKSQTLKRGSKEKLHIANMSKYGEPACHKQRNAFSPNFIHSLDSCHMILTGLYCEQAGITYVSVHDCFWVHACNIEAMSKICREQFVNLHSKPILQELSEFLQKTYASDDSISTNDKAVAAVESRRLRRLFASVPPKGNFDLNEVLKSKYFFS